MLKRCPLGTVKQNGKCVPRRTKADEELERVQDFMKNSTEPYDDWEWDGKTLVVFGGTGGRTERYTRKDLKDFDVLD
jgi:hypothetical protein